MGLGIVYYDIYDLKKFKIGDIDNFIDIGAHTGIVSVMARILMPDARILAFEPCKETFDKHLTKELKKWRIEGYNIALGNGTPMCFDKRRRSQSYRFYIDNDEERQFWPKDYEYTIESKTLSDIFKDYNISIDSSYIIKMDCEGGERFLVREGQRKEALDLIRGSVQTMIEIHFGFGGTKEQWNFFLKELQETHQLRIVMRKNRGTKKVEYISCTELTYSKGHAVIELINKEWFGKNKK